MAARKITEFFTRKRPLPDPVTHPEPVDDITSDSEGVAVEEAKEQVEVPTGSSAPKSPAVPVAKFGPIPIDPFSATVSSLVNYRQLSGRGFPFRIHRRHPRESLLGLSLQRFGVSFGEWRRREEAFHDVSKAILSVRFDAEGVLIACGGSEGKLSLVHIDEVNERQLKLRNKAEGDTEKLNLLFESNKTKDIRCVGWNPGNQNRIATSHLCSNGVSVFDVASDRRTPLTVFDSDTNGVTGYSGNSLLFTDGGQGLACGFSSGFVRFWDARCAPNRPKWEFSEAPRTTTVSTTATPLTGSAPVTLSGLRGLIQPGGLGGLSGRAPQLALGRDSPKSPVSALCQSANPSQFYVGFDDGTLRVYDCRKLIVPAFGGKSVPGTVLCINIASELSTQLAVPIHTGVKCVLRNSSCLDTLVVVMSDGLTVTVSETSGSGARIRAVIARPSVLNSPSAIASQSAALMNLWDAPVVGLCQGPGMPKDPTRNPLAGLALHSETAPAVAVGTDDPLLCVDAAPQQPLFAAGTESGDLAFISPSSYTKHLYDFRRVEDNDERPHVSTISWGFH